MKKDMVWGVDKLKVDFITEDSLMKYITNMCMI